MHCVRVRLDPARYSGQMAELFTEVYNWLPLAHCLAGKVLVSALFDRILVATVMIFTRYLAPTLP